MGLAAYTQPQISTTLIIIDEHGEGSKKKRVVTYGLDVLWIPLRAMQNRRQGTASFAL